VYSDGGTFCSVHLKGSKFSSFLLQEFDTHVSDHIPSLHKITQYTIQDVFIKCIAYRRKLRWYRHLARMAEDRKPRQILEARREGKRGRGRPRRVWMNDIKEAAGRRGKTIQEARCMAMTRKDFTRWTEDPTLKGKRDRYRRRRRRRRRSIAY
jgi:hypothetical protein